MAKSCTGEAPEAPADPLQLPKLCSRLHGSSLFTFPVFLLNAAKKAPRCSTLGAPGGPKGPPQSSQSIQNPLLGGLGCPLGAKRGVEAPREAKIYKKTAENYTKNALQRRKNISKRYKKVSMVFRFSPSVCAAEWFSAFPFLCVFLLFHSSVVFSIVLSDALQAFRSLPVQVPESVPSWH